MTSQVSTEAASRLRQGAMPLGDFLRRGFREDVELLGKMIREKTVGMIAGPRGGGKSWLALLVAYSVAGGKLLEPWGTGGEVSVAYLDGEMRANGLQERLRLIHARNSVQASKDLVERNLHVVSRDCCGGTVGFIDTSEGQERIDALIPCATKLVILDNLSAWTSGGREDGNAWAAIKNWLILKRVQGTSVILVHHAGKNGQQRGSSAHEDLLDFSILLAPLPGDAERQDTRFIVDHTKLRDHIPALRRRFEFGIWTEGGELQFESMPVGFDVSAHAAEMSRLKEEGLSCEAIGQKLGVSKSTVSRTLAKLRAQGTDG